MLARGPLGLAEVGVFSAAYAWGTGVLTVPAHVSRQAMPILARLLAAGRQRDFRRLLRDNLLLTSAIASVIGAVATALRSTLTAAGYFWGQVTPSLLWGLALVAAFFLLRHRGALGLAIAYVVAFSVSLVVQGAMSILAHGTASVPDTPPPAGAFPD